jgi:hypothetical protein
MTNGASFEECKHVLPKKAAFVSTVTSVAKVSRDEDNQLEAYFATPYNASTKNDSRIHCIEFRKK